MRQPTQAERKENMTDPNAQPAPTLEETEAALANMPLSVANILRRRLGLAPAEPEPEAAPAPVVPAPEPETSVRAAIREQLADLDPTARAIDTEALKLVDAEIAEKAKAEQEAAARAAEAAKVVKPSSDAVTAALEPIKARAARRLSPVKRRLEEGSVAIRAEAPHEVIYQHSVFCQTVLPYRDPGPDVRVWERQQGNASLSLEAGRIRGPKGLYIPVGLPYGPTARLILVHLNTQALQTRNRVIDVGGSMTSFVARLYGFSPDGRQIHKFKDQLSRLNGCLVRIAYNLGDHAVQVNSTIVGGFDLWEESFESERFLFPQQIVLSADYFENLLAHAVPLDERAIAALAHSAMALDVYMWLAQRLHRIDPQRPQFITWVALHAQFGQGYKNIRQFRADFKTSLNQVLTQYPEARVKFDKGGMWLANSPPPVPSRHVILLPPVKPAKG